MSSTFRGILLALLWVPAGVGGDIPEAGAQEPADPTVRGARLVVERGRELLDADETDRAREILRLVAEDPDAPPEARIEAYLELAGAERRADRSRSAEAHLRRILELRPDHPRALRLLRVLHRGRVPWLRADGSLSDDDQPLRRYSAALEGGLRLRPGLFAELRAGLRRLGAEVAEETLTSARATVRGRWDLLNLEGAAWGGGFRRDGAVGGDWTGGGALAVRGPGGVVVRGEVERSPYLRTAASLERSIPVVSVGGTVGRPDAGGWAGAVRYREERFEDGNRVEAAAGWFLAPVVRDSVGTFRVGYRFRAADAEESAFVPADPLRLDREGRVAGRYSPVYTPRQLRSHSVLAEVRHEREGAFRLVMEGSLGFAAREDAPLLFPAVPGAPGSGVDLQFTRRDFTPWHVAGDFELSLSPGVVLSVSAGYRRTAFRDRSFVETGWVLYDLPEELR